MTKNKATSMAALYPLAIMNCEEKHENFVKYCQPMLDALGAIKTVVHNGISHKVCLILLSYIDCDGRLIGYWGVT